MKHIDPADLICMNEYAAARPLRVELAYASDDNALLGQRIYHERAKLWLHKSLADIVLRAAEIYHAETGGRFVLYDGLRTTEAQEAMLHTKRVKENPHWLEEPRMLSPPGAGAHPRGMAIDLSLEDKNGALLDMGTVFDAMCDDPSPAHNPAHREYVHLTPEIKANREILNSAMLRAADEEGQPLHLLAEEWWDFRLPADMWNEYEPLSDSTLPPEMRMVRNP